MGERRQSVRQKSFLRGCIAFADGRKSADCIVRDMTQEGARLTLSDPTSIPDLIELNIPQKNLMVGARVQWRRGVALGVVFSQVAKTPAEPQINELPQSILQLQNEIASLWRALNELKDQVAKQSGPDAA